VLRGWTKRFIPIDVSVVNRGSRGPVAHISSKFQGSGCANFFQRSRSLGNNFLSRHKPTLQICNVNDASKTMYLCNNLGKLIILDFILGGFSSHWLFVLLSTKDRQSFLLQPHTKARVEFIVKVLGETCSSRVFYKSDLGKI